MTMTIESRQAANVRFQTPLCSHLKIAQVFGEKKESKSAKIIISEISYKGLRFKSFLKLPKNENIIWSFQIKIKETVLTVMGTISDYRLDTQGCYEYDVKWKVEEGTRESLLYMYNKVSLGYNFFNNYVSYKQQVDLLY